MSLDATWVTLPLPEVLEFREGPGIMARDFRDQGVPLIRLTGLKRGSPILQGCNYLDPDMVEQRWSHFRVRLGDVLLSTSASLGEVAVVDESAEGAIPYTGIIAFRPRTEFIIPTFIQYALRSPSFRRQIEAMGAGSVLRHFGPSHLKGMTVDLPPVWQQSAIAHILGALDNKIAANEQTAVKAVELASAVFTSAVEQGAIHAHLGDIAEFHNKRRVPLSSRERAAFCGPYPYYGATGVIDYVGGYRFDGKYVLVGEDGTVIHDDGSPVLQYVRGRFWVSNHAHVLTGLGISNEVLMFALRNVDVLPYVTGAVQPKLSMGNLKNVPITLPTRQNCTLNDTLSCLCDLAAQKDAENAQLAHFRDALLPRLLSGAVRARISKSTRRSAL